MWGPANALLEENLSSDQQGLTPRVFQRLFARINEVGINFVGCQNSEDQILQCPFYLLCRSKSNMLTNNWSINVAALFLRLITVLVNSPIFSAYVAPNASSNLFLQIYNEQITDLLDPNQRNLQVIKKIRFCNLSFLFILTKIVFLILHFCHLSDKRRCEIWCLCWKSKRRVCVFNEGCDSTSDKGLAF